MEEEIKKYKEDQYVKEALQCIRHGDAIHEVSEKFYGKLPEPTPTLMPCLRKCIKLGIITQEEMEHIQEKIKIEKKEEIERKEIEKYKNDEQVQKMLQCIKNKEPIDEVSKKFYGKLPEPTTTVIKCARKCVELGLIEAEEIEGIFGRAKRKPMTEQQKTMQHISDVGIDYIEKTIQDMCNEFSGQNYILASFKRYISYCKKKYKDGIILDYREIALVGKIASLIGSYSDGVFYIKLCLKKGKIVEAKEFINMQINDDRLSEYNRNNMKKLKDQVELIEKNKIAIDILKNGQGTQLQKIQRAQQVTRIKRN